MPRDKSVGGLRRLDKHLRTKLALPRQQRKLKRMQILIRFPDKDTERHALGKLIPRFSGKSWSSGETAVSSAALSYLADEGISFVVNMRSPSARHSSLSRHAFYGTVI